MVINANPHVSPQLDLALVDLALIPLAVATGHTIVQLAAQPSIRIFKRYFMRLWIFGMAVCVLELLVGRHAGVRYAIAVGYHASVALMLARRYGCLETNLEAHSVSLDMGNVLSKIQAVSVAQCLLGGIVAYRFQFGCPLVLALPVVLLCLERHKCTCEYRELVSKQVSVVSLVVSSLALLLLASTVQQSPLLSPAMLNSANDLSLQLDLSITVQAWFELVLACFLGLCHVLMLVLSVMAVAPHNCALTSKVPNLDCWLMCYTLVIPVSLGFIFCSTGISSAALALISATAGARILFM